MNFRWLPIALSATLVLGCDGKVPSPDSGESVDSPGSIISAIRLGYREARQDGVDLSSYDVSTVRRMGNGVNSFSQVARRAEHPLLAKLEGFHYWEICFAKLDLETGPTHCYYVDRGSGRLILSHVE